MAKGKGNVWKRQRNNDVILINVKEITNMKTLILTGATGFLGSHLLRKLLRETDYSIVVLKRSFSNTFRINDLLNEGRVKCYNIDCVPLKLVFEKSPAEIIIHAATNFGRNNDNIPEIVEANLVLPLKLLQYGEEFGLNIFINCDTVIEKNINHYTLSKSQFLEWLKNHPNIKCVNMRIEHFYGANDNRTKFATFIVRSLLENAANIDLTIGEQKRHFIYIDDVVDAFFQVFKSATVFNNGFIEFDVSTESSNSIKEFVLLAKELSGNTQTHLNFGALPYRAGEVMNINTDIEALKALGWRPKVSLTEGLNMMINEEKR